MNRDDNKIKNKINSEKQMSVKTAASQGPTDDCGNPVIPNKPTPNPDRPKRKNEPKPELEYTNGVQKEGNVVSVKVHPDSTNYMRTYKDGLSIKYLINKLECVRKSMDKLKDGLNQLKDEVQPAGIIKTIVTNSTDFQTILTYLEAAMMSDPENQATEQIKQLYDYVKSTVEEQNAQNQAQSGAAQ